MRFSSLSASLLFLLFVVATSCRQASTSRFELMPGSQTGVTFANTLTQTDRVNAFTFTNFYNGGGVGVGDVNNDGKPDVFFGGNQVSSRLYLNQIDSTTHTWKFEDITESAGVATNQWCTGISMIDLNGDGWLDIYVSVAKTPGANLSKNRLFINQGLKNGKPVFKEMADEYGLADDSYTTQTAFFDYDLDGDLDAYLLNTAPDLQNPNILRQTYNDGTYPSTGKLFRNEGLGAQGHPVFANVSKQAGIVYEGLGLGLAISDLNKDGYPDIYCSNDFISSDILYLNKGRQTADIPTFTNVIRQATAHTSLYGMGVDVADFNNDGLPDIFQLDMLPEENARQKKMLAGQDYDRKELSVAAPYHYQMQYMRNSLQLNLGTEGMGQRAWGRGLNLPAPPAPSPMPSASIPYFSEVGLLAGIAKTDWSWSALFADYDNDGQKDLYITNGYRRDVTDRDFIQFTEEFSGFGTTEFQKDKREELIQKVPEVKVPNYAYRNTGNLSFSDVSNEWGLASLSYSNGAAYADLDNDGDLDLVVNNIDSEAFIYQNTTNKQSSGHFISMQFAGEPGNRQGIGTKVTLWTGGQMQYAELSVVRGFQSSVEPFVHFGLGKAVTIDSLMVEWPGGKIEKRYQVRADQRLTFRYKNASSTEASSLLKAVQPIFTNVATAITPAFQHRTSDFVDFKQTAALHKMLSQNSFALATGDINGDGLDDCFVGGTYRGSKACFLLQTAQGGFQQKPFPADAEHDDTAALLFDADGDKDLDLYVARGGCQRPAADKTFYQDQLYLNNGRGEFAPSPAGSLPDLSGSAGCVTAADFDQDGDLDLFVGGRMMPGSYPLPARSYLLRNDQANGIVKFTDVTKQVCPWLLKAGLVCSALWTDTNQDSCPDLILAGEWMPVTVLQGERAVGKGQRDNNTFTLRPLPAALSTLPAGWWYSLAQGDFDHDGDMDYVAGNEGLNTLYRASEREPIKMVASDFNNDGTFDPIMGYYIKGVCYPAVPRDALNQQIIQFRRKYQHYADYAQVQFADLFTKDELKNAYQAQVTWLQSAYIENLGNNRFRVSPLPRLAQQSPVYGIVPYDFNKDGNLDVVLTGNFYPNEVNMGRQDASVGLVLFGNGHGQFRVELPAQSGLLVAGDARQSTLITGKGTTKLLVTAVNGQGIAVNRYQPPATNPAKK